MLTEIQLFRKREHKVAIRRKGPVMRTGELTPYVEEVAHTPAPPQVTAKKKSNSSWVKGFFHKIWNRKV